MCEQFRFYSSLTLYENIAVDTERFLYTAASGALTSGLGFSIWYAVLPSLKATNTNAVQRSVPIISAIGGILFLGEPLSLRLVIELVAILGGTALVISGKQQRS